MKSVLNFLTMESSSRILLALTSSCVGRSSPADPPMKTMSTSSVCTADSSRYSAG